MTTHPSASAAAPADAGARRPWRRTRPGHGSTSGVTRPPLRVRLWRGRPEDAGWARPALLVLLTLTTCAYLWNLSASGYANSFYSAAVQAGSSSWKAWFFGSLDAGNAITVDKPPAALWPMALSVRLFGLSSWSILVPQVLMATATAAVLYAAVRRRFSAPAGLLAVAVFGLTPVAALMFRFNNPDALLALLTVVALYCVLRAVEDGRTRWLAWAGAALGLAFLTKTLQALLIVPPLALLYAVCAPVRPRRRLVQLLAAGAVMVVAGGWWVAIVEWWPAASRPYVGGSQNNSFLELTLGYNGLGRLNGEETGSFGGGRGGGPGGGAFGGGSGPARLFDTAVGGQIAWLLPAALLLLLAGLVVTRKAARTDTARAAFLAWGGSLVMTAAVFSFMAGIFHEYYTAALAPYIAALVGMGVAVLWEERSHIAARGVLAFTVAATGAWSFVLLSRTPDYLPWLRWAVAVGALVAGAALLLPVRAVRWRVGLTAALALAACLAGPAAYTATTLSTGHSGSIVTAGPAGADRMGPPAGRIPGGAQPPGPGGPGAQTPEGSPPVAGTRPGQPEGGPGAGRAGVGAMLNGAQVSSQAKELLRRDADDYTWAAASVGSQNAATYQLATGEPIMAIGGFSGTDPSPTLEQFKQYVAQGRIHYLIAGGGTGGAPDRGTEGRHNGAFGGSGTAAQITAWVEQTYQRVTVGGTAFYDLGQARD
ncbi:glycosyltransferase family 39 protein [Streptomyces sp. NPDC047097]|uniref:ArnT family glycosyltransferase n=1 Tax=Streptomyces sp. NPDC047097 TaxID=3155260 RepID=UPI0033FE58EF